MKMNKRRRVLVLSGWLRPAMASGLAMFARQADWHLDLGSMVTGGLPRGLACDGMLVFHSERADLASLARRQATQCPTVLVSGMKPILDAPIVREDNVGIGRMAAQHFLERGFRQFAWLSNDNRRVSQDRRAGFLAALHETGMSCQCIEWPKPLKQQWREYSRWVARHLTSLARPLALFVTDDMTAVNVVEICKDHGLRVPEDVAILGVGNDALICDFSDVPVSSIEVDWGDIVYRAAELLDGLMRKKSPPKQPLIFPPRRVVVRASTDILAVSDPYLTAALEYVRRHFREPITVRDVARAVGVTRRTLENHFRRHLRSGLAEEIRRRKIAYAQELLLNTDLAIADIAAQAGFETAIYLAKVFKRTVGIQPSRYREQRRRPGS